MAKTVVIIGTLDTKGVEVVYLRDRLQAFGLATIVVDSGILGEPIGITLDPEQDISRVQAAEYAGTNIDALRNAGSRGKAVEKMRQALKVLTLELYKQGRLDAITSMGGAEGAVMGAAAMMQLPVGVPKLLVSPIASGKHYFAPMNGTSDIMVMHSIVDILGLKAALALLLASSPVRAQVERDTDRIDITGRQNLTLGSGARAYGKGGAFLARADDATAASWNPAGLSYLRVPEISLVGVSNSFEAQKGVEFDPNAVDFDRFDGRAIDFAAFTWPVSLGETSGAIQVSYSAPSRSTAHARTT